MTFKFIQTNEKDEDFVSLVNELDDEYFELFGEIAFKYRSINALTSEHHVIIAYKNEDPVACGSFRMFSKDTVELKRFFVRKEHRRNGLASAILNRLEELAKKKGFNFVVLETGVDMPNAISLYKKHNYWITDNFEDFIGDDIVVCMKKELR